MPFEITMPALSPTMTSGRIAKWTKNEGDEVKSGDVIVEIETDKAIMEFEAMENGKLGKIIIPNDTNDVAVGTVIGVILLKNETEKDLKADYTTVSSKVAQKIEEIVKEKETVQKVDVNSNYGDRIFASPLAKRIAKDKGINLSNITGTGPRGRIVKADLENVNFSVCTQKRPSGLVEKIPLTTMRKVIATRLQESKANAPHFYLFADCNVDNLLLFREKINLSLSRDGKSDKPKKVSINDLVVKITAHVLAKHRNLNASWSDDSITHYSDVNVAVAVSIKDGLVTPVVRNADLKTITEISDEIKDLASKAKDGKLSADNYNGGTITISNIGMYGVESFLAIINPPQASILAVGAVIKKPIVKNDQIVVGNIMSISLSIDHRVVDGADGAKFLSDLKAHLEDPVMMMV